MSQRRQSITRRLLLATVATLPLFLGITGYAIDRAHSHSLRMAENDRLRLHFYSLLGVMEWDDDGNIDMERLKEPSFWQFRSGLYAAIAAADGAPLWISPSASTLQLPLLDGETAAGRELFDSVDGDSDPFFRLRYHILWESESGEEIPLQFTLLASQATYRLELASFRREITLWLSAAAAILLLIQTTVLRWGLAPLRRLTGELEELESGQREQLPGDYPRELAGITRNLNRLLHKEHKQRERYRNTLADLAHSLKTPLSVLKSTIGSGDGDPRLLDEQLQRMDSIIGYQLQRAVSAGARQLGQKTALRPVAERLLNTLQKVYQDKGVTADNAVANSLRLAIDEHDLMELLGNLLDNAFKACRGKVRVSCSSHGDTRQLLIEDDGPGVSTELAEKLLQRGQRGDQYGSGQGLGLSIVSDIVDAYGGDIQFGNSELGGAAVSINLPDH